MTSDPFPPHVCFYSDRLIWSDWERSGEMDERVARRVPVCSVCGRERTALRPRPAVRKEIRAAVPAAAPLADEAGRTVAMALLRRGAGAEGREIRAQGLLSSLARRGVPASLAEEWLDRFLRAAWIEMRWIVGRGSNRIEAVILRDVQALQEMVHPGLEARRRASLAEARERLAPLIHPKAQEIATLLDGDGAEALSPRIVDALAAIAVHLESAETLAERVFSARALGDSKALASLRGRLERLIGPLAKLGIREGAAVTLLGGRVALRLPGALVDLEPLAPFAGFARETLESAEEIVFPSGGLLVVENLTAFEACCRGEVAATGDVLIAWSAGYPGRAVRRLVAAAGAAGAPVRVWADLDLDGIRIARLIASWAPAVTTPWRMGRAELVAAPASIPLSTRATAAILRDLEERPGALLADTLQAILELRRWVEQEAFLASPGR